ncbi:YigZ family protein [Lujinxingia litoralis]|uniref:YigZ family protein n=1 Tax=Lujinxingia litoralis TaxID=2211119 RepID=A0A328C520_9DELT|nr:YigZ family protein [Lujinxingia litoralis]RAL22349.1 YigZ family protein [Lujinxingia litoralis]
MRVNTPDEEQPYWTLAGVGTSEHVVERSRFLGYALAVSSEEEAQAFIAEKRREFYDARHVCFAFRLGRGAQPLERSSDDGEPARTAGFPMLQILEGLELVDVLVVVVRYFGGIKLGTGGLARAYREAARQAVEAAGPERRFPQREVALNIPYGVQAQVEHLLGPMEEVEVLRVDYAADVTLHLGVRCLALEDLRARLATLLQRDGADVFEGDEG